MADPRLPVVVHLRRVKGRVVQDCDIYIGRACYRGGWTLPQSPWHNPFSLGKYGRDEALRLYEAHARRLIAAGTLRLVNLLPGEDGKPRRLGCWCTPEPCHGDILRHLVAEWLAAGGAP